MVCVLLKYHITLCGKKLSRIWGLFCAKNVRMSVLSLWTILSYQDLYLDIFTSLCFSRAISHQIGTATSCIQLGKALGYDHMMGRVSVKMCSNGQNTYACLCAHFTRIGDEKMQQHNTHTKQPFFLKDYHNSSRAS
mmetsp:Transcript_5599/g.12134  ORF Transcript_5599/g.12134 Transcript_5599/m.12134 type:complete len:136 (+) Transcript_5599:54-461(+)